MAMSKEIDYVTLFNEGKNKPAGYTIKSPSKHELQITFSPVEVSIKDIKDDYFYMLATNTAGILELSLITKKGNLRHPDMKARQFIAFCLNHFSTTAFPIKAFRGIWYGENNVNYKKFRQIYELTDNKVVAAKYTWSGKTFISFGFTEISDGDVEIKNGYPKLDIQGEVVLALFSKPK